jgi:hypothetical protein
MQNCHLPTTLVSRQQEKGDLVNTQSDMDNSGGTDSDSEAIDTDFEESG